MSRDFQRTKCYRWEDVHVHPRDKSHVKFEHAQALVDYVWQQEGLQYPPRVVALPNQCRTTQATGGRLKISIPEKGIQTTILLHEIAHSMTTTIEGESAHHGPRWMGVFMMLLSKYAAFSLPEMMFTAKSAGVQFNFSGKVM